MYEGHTGVFEENTATGFDYFWVATGKIAEMRQEVDQFGMMQQLGVLPAPQQ
jgi:hypothetical protein